MRSQFHSAGFLLLSLTTVFVGGCNDKVDSRPVTQREIVLPPEQQLVALRNRAAAGDAGAQYDLAVKYAKGDGVAEDDTKALEWFHKAAVQGVHEAQLQVGVRYFLGMTVPEDSTTAVEWFEKAASQGNAEAQYMLGGLYDAIGETGVVRDSAQAARWYQKAAINGYAPAQTQLAINYYSGHGVDKDVSKALEWFQRAAAQDDGKAQYFLGVMYYKGTGVAKDLVLAYAWFNLAAAKSIPEVAGVRDLLEAKLPASEISEAQRLSSRWTKGQLLNREG